MPFVTVLFVFVWVLAIVGWVANIVQTVGMAYEPITTLLILKIVGIFAAPLGSVLGIAGMF